MNQPDQNNQQNPSDRNDELTGGNLAHGTKTEYVQQTQEKTSLGGDFNSGVTSNDDAEKEEIQKKGALANIDQSGVKTNDEHQTEEGRS